MHVKEIFERQPPQRLYHYTTQAGVLGIVGNQEIWASHTQYLNDVREFRHALSLAEEELMKMNQPGAYEKEHRVLLDEMRQVIDGAESINVCVCSFSEDGDVLSQWRAYGGSAGFSVGFAGAFLKAISAHSQYWLVPVLYAEHAQRALIRGLLEDVLAENIQRLQRQNSCDADEVDLPPGGNLLAYLNRYAPILKHESFSEEREWRIISQPVSCKSERFGYRPGTSMLIPYVRLALSAPEHPFRIDEIVVGPTPYPEQSAQSVKGLLIRSRLRHCTVINSRVPFRSW